MKKPKPDTYQLRAFRVVHTVPLSCREVAALMGVPQEVARVALRGLVQRRLIARQGGCKMRRYVRLPNAHAPHNRLGTVKASLDNLESPTKHVLLARKMRSLYGVYHPPVPKPATALEECWSVSR